MSKPSPLKASGARTSAFVITGRNAARPKSLALAGRASRRTHSKMSIKRVFFLRGPFSTCYCCCISKPSSFLIELLTGIPKRLDTIRKQKTISFCFCLDICCKKRNGIFGDFLPRFKNLVNCCLVSVSFCIRELNKPGQLF